MKRKVVVVVLFNLFGYDLLLLLLEFINSKNVNKPDGLYADHY